MKEKSFRNDSKGQSLAFCLLTHTMSPVAVTVRMRVFKALVAGQRSKKCWVNGASHDSLLLSIMGEMFLPGEGGVGGREARRRHPAQEVLMVRY